MRTLYRKIQWWLEDHKIIGSIVNLIVVVAVVGGALMLVPKSKSEAAKPKYWTDQQQKQYYQSMFKQIADRNPELDVETTKETIDYIMDHLMLRYKESEILSLSQEDQVRLSNEFSTIPYHSGEEGIDHYAVNTGGVDFTGK
jgi:hypothetical protein